MSGPPEGDGEGKTSARPLRVCLVGPSLDILGGQSVQLARLQRRLEEVPSLEVSFLPVNPRLPGPFRALQRVKYVRTVSTVFAYVWHLLRQVPRCDVVHAFSASYWSFVVAPFPALVISRLFGKGVVLNYHSGELEDHLHTWRRTAIPSMRLAHRIVVPSGYLVDVFRRFGIGAQAIFNFVEAERFPYRLRANARPIFLSNRNHEALYNVACTLRAFAIVQRVIPEARLIAAGDGAEHARLRALAAELELRNVDFIGRTSPERMIALYDEADVYLNSPDIDNMPLSVIEAYAAGLPVATTDAGGVPYIVRDGDTGLLVSRNDHEALARAALRIVREPGLSARLSAAGREECLSRYVWPRVRPQWEQLYASVAAEVRGEAAAAHSELAA